jgi:hypothetical protein
VGGGRGTAGDAIPLPAEKESKQDNPQQPPLLSDFVPEDLADLYTISNEDIKTIAARLNCLVVSSAHPPRLSDLHPDGKENFGEDRGNE